MLMYTTSCGASKELFVDPDYLSSTESVSLTIAILRLSGQAYPLKIMDLSVANPGIIFFLLTVIQVSGKFS